MFAFATRMFRDKYKSFIIYSLSAVGFIEMYIALYPAISKQSGQFDQLLKSMPPELFKAMNMDPATLSFTNLQSFLSSEYMSFLWPILAIVFAVSLANYIVVNEIDKGTIETLASLPANRARIFIERYTTGLLILAGFCFISIISAVPLAILHNAEFVFVNYLTASVGAFFFVWAVYSLATLTSVIFSEKGKSSMVSGGILMLMYVIYVVATLNDSFRNLKYTSFFNYFSGSELLAKNAYPEYSLLALGGFAIVAMIGALVWFQRRDLSV